MLRGHRILPSAVGLCIAASSLTAHAQVSLFFRPPAPEKIEAALASLDPQSRVVIENSIRDVAPVFILLPGVLGSKLVKTLPGGKTDTIWGRLDNPLSAANKEIAYEETDKVDAEILDEFYAAAGFGADVYGKAVTRLKQVLGAKRVMTFAYDWRQSNARSSLDLSKWLCDRRTAIAGRPVIFIAHSMGGLVLRHWFSARFAESGCGDGDDRFKSWIDVGKIIFLGTPHYGAPKAILAFADQVNLLVDPGTLPQILFGGIDRLTFSKNLNAFGATFPSAYELLPIANTSSCLRDDNWPKPISIRIGNIDRASVDLFDADMWKGFGWPKNLDSSVPREKFVNENLPRLLQNAEKFLCDLAKHDIDAAFKGKVVRFYGTKSKTICQIVVTPSDKEGALPAVALKYCTRSGGPSDDAQPGDEGDGTVPRWVASDQRRSSIDFMHSLNEKHVALASSQQFLDYVEGLHEEVHRNLRRRASRTPDGEKATVSFYTKLAYLVPPAAPTIPLGASKFIFLAGLDSPQITDTNINRQVAAALGVQPRDIYNAAKEQTNVFAIGSAYRVFAGLAAPGDPLRGWALNNAALNYLQANQFDLAKPYALEAIRLGNELPMMAQYKDIKAKASLTAAIASYAQGDVDSAKFLRNVAVSYGNPRASSFALQD